MSPVVQASCPCSWAVSCLGSLILPISVRPRGVSLYAETVSAALVSFRPGRVRGLRNARKVWRVWPAASFTRSRVSGLVAGRKGSGPTLFSRLRSYVSLSKTYFSLEHCVIDVYGVTLHLPVSSVFFSALFFSAIALNPQGQADFQTAGSLCDPPA